MTRASQEDMIDRKQVLAYNFCNFDRPCQYFPSASDELLQGTIEILPALPAQRCPSLRYIIIVELRDTIPSSNAGAGLLLLDYQWITSMDTLKWKMKQLISR